MKMITQDAVIKIVKDSIKNALSDEQIGHINDLLIEATYNFNTHSGMNYMNIDSEKIPGENSIPLRLLASLLKSNGWDAQFKSDQRDGEWINVNLPIIVS